MAFFTKKDRLFIVVNILSGSMFDHYFEKFDIISYVNKKPMKTLNDFKKIFFPMKNPSPHPSSQPGSQLCLAARKKSFFRKTTYRKTTDRETKDLCRE